MQFWRWSFGLLVAVPALVLALLGMRAVRAERLEREQQLRDRQAQTAQLVDAGMRLAFSEIERELQQRESAPETGPPREGVHFFSFERSGRIVFSDDRLYFAPQSDAIDWPVIVEELIERARAAETQHRASEAGNLYRRIIAVEPRLRRWAQLSVLRLEQKDDLSFLTTISNENQVTPSGLPVALVAVARLEALPAEQRERYRELIERTHSRLRTGQWWLSFEEQRFYDHRLGRMLGAPGSDGRLQQLAGVARLAGDAPLRRDEPTHHLGRIEGRLTLILLWPSKQSSTLWQGAALSGNALGRLFKTLPTGGARIADANGNAIWGVQVDNIAGRAEPLSVVHGWKLVFPHLPTSWFDQRALLWLGFIALLIVTMLASLAGTLGVVRREAELARLQNDFIAGVSHDFKSPITGIRLLLERMASGRITSIEAAAQYRAATERELTRLERHVNRLLEAQQIQVGERRYVFAPASLSEIVADAVAELTTEADARRIVVQNETGAGRAVRVDREAMAGAVANLIGNAIKYSSVGSRINVTTRADNSHAVIEVEDEGIGIDAADMGKIFRRFYRGYSARRTGVNGTGLGLTLVKATVQAHGGQVSATSAPGKGSRFTISLPLAEC